jgi:putative flippase GtrA
MLRYGISGAAVTLVYLGLPVVVNAALGVPIQICIPVAYVLAVSLQFILQRHFVFRHVSSFALSARQQITWYVIVGAIQYPLSALAVAVLPGLLDIPERVAYLVATATISLFSFLFLRKRVFHPHPESP